MTPKRTFICRACGVIHERRVQAVECCMAGDALSPDELEIIGQQRLFDDGIPANAARVPLEADEGSPQLLLF